MKKEVKKLLNGEVIISNVVKSAGKIKKTYIGIVDYIRELPRDLSVKDWIQMQKINDSLIHGEQESLDEFSENTE